MVINNATWGYYSSKKDVTNYISSLYSVVTGTVREFQVSNDNSNLGYVKDCNGFIKELEIWFTCDNEEEHHIIIQCESGNNDRFLSITNCKASARNTEKKHETGLIVIK